MSWSDRSTDTTKEIKERLTKFVEQKEIACDIIHTMIGFNDRIIIRPKEIPDHAATYGAVSLILSWMYADADMAAVIYSNKDDSIVRYVTSEILQFKNDESDVNPERWELAEPIRNNDVKYYPPNFDDPQIIDQIVEDMKKCIEQITARYKISYIINFNRKDGK